MKFLRTSLVAALFLSFVFVPPFAHAQTRDDLLAQLASLQAQLQTLLAQASGVSNTFDHDLQLGDTGPDVLLLQRVLNTFSTTQVAEEGYGAPGEETSYFGQLTYGAVLRFQEAYRSQILTPLNLTAPTGFVGPATRAVLNSVLHRLGRGASSDAAGAESEAREEVTATSTPETSLRERRSGGGGDHTAPDAPGSFAVSAGDGQVTLTWTDPLAGDEETISIYRGTSSDSLSLLTTVSPGTQTYTDSSLPNDTTYYYALDATDVNSNTSDRTATKSATTVGVYDIYVDSVNGNDDSDGTSDVEALKTLAAAETMATAEGDGVKIGLAKGSYWREQLDLSALQDVSVSSYGDTGSVPTIDASDLLLSWSKTPGYTNLYQSTLGTESQSGNIHYAAWGDNVDLTARASLALVDANPGSAFIDSSGANPIVYVHTSQSDNPASNGMSYDVTARRTGIDLSGIGETGSHQLGGSVEGVHFQRNLGDNGSVILGSSATLRRVVASQGHYHNALIGDGEIEDVVVFDKHSVVGGAMLVAYSNSPSSKQLSVERFYAVGLPVSPATYDTAQGFYTHQDGGGKFSTVTLRQFATLNTSGSLDFGNTDAATFAGGYLQNSAAILTPASSSTIDYLQVNGLYSTASKWTNPSTHMRHLASYNGPQIGPIVGATIENSIFVSNISSGVTSAVSEDLTSNFNVLIGYGSAGNPELRTDKATYAGDHNVFYHPVDARTVYIRDESSTNYFTLSSWQTASGQDQNSVYLTTAQFEDFFLGDPADGDFSINPNAQVTAADGTVYTGEFPDGTPITEAGPQFHWDWNAREAVAGTPSAWPNIPDTLAESKEYVLDPQSWEF